MLSKRSTQKHPLTVHTAKLPLLCPCCGQHHIRQKYAKMCIHCKADKKREKREVKQFKNSMNDIISEDLKNANKYKK